MVDINSRETTDVDVETLMGLIRRRVLALPDARHIMGEIGKGRLYVDGITEAPPRRAGWKGRAKSQLTNFILRAVGRNLHLQRVFNHSVAGVLQLIAEDLYAYEKRLPAAREAEPAARAGTRPPAPRGGDEVDEPAFAERFDQASYEEKYLDFTAYRRRCLSIFRELLTGGDVALELGCGRGELLAAFAESGITAVGVDSDKNMVSLCRGRGLRASHADIFDYLRGSPDASFGGIFANRVVERLTCEQTFGLLELAARKLRRGGVLVVGATNIDHLPALRRFYMDPSLVRPVPVRLLEFMLGRCHFRVDHFRFSSAGGDRPGGEELVEPALSREIYPYDNYTVAAVRG